MEENKVKKPFPKIRLNKSNREWLKQAVKEYLENKYPRISSEVVERRMGYFLENFVSYQDARTLEKFGSLHRKQRLYYMRQELENGEKHYVLDEFYLGAVPGTGCLSLYTWELSGHAIPSKGRIIKTSRDHPALVEYARACEERFFRIRQEEQAWFNIVDTTVIASRLPEEARPFVEEVFLRKVERDRENLAIIRRFDKED